MDPPGQPPPNPYAAPSARVDDPSAAGRPGAFRPEGVRVPTSHGVRWIVEGFGIWKPHPGLWIGIAFAFTLMNAVVGFIPLAGVVILPVWTAGTMLGCQAIMTGTPLRFSHLFSGFAANAGRLMAFGLAGLGLVIGATFVTMLIGRMLLPQASLMEILLNPVDLLLLAAVFLALVLPVTMLLWFGPPLIVLSDESVGAALRSSFLACAKNWLPFTVYGLILLVFFMVAPFLAASAGGYIWLSFNPGPPTPDSLFGMVVLATALSLAVSCLFLPLLFTSLYASFRDIFYRP